MKIKKKDLRDNLIFKDKRISSIFVKKHIYYYYAFFWLMLILYLFLK